MKGSILSMAAIKHIEQVHKGYVINVIAASKSGTADLIACIDGRFFAFEIKGEGDTVKRLQNEKLNLVAKAGGYGGYVYSIDDIDYLIDTLIRPQISSNNNKISL